MSDKPSENSDILTGKKLKVTNEKLCEYILTLKSKRAELNHLIEAQQKEKRRLEGEIECYRHRINLMAKSLAQRLAARDKYDQTIKEAEENYQRIVECSGILLNSVQKEYGVLSEAIDKRVGTEAEDFKPYDNIEVKVDNLDDYNIQKPEDEEQEAKPKLQAESDMSNQASDAESQSGSDESDAASVNSQTKIMSELPTVQMVPRRSSSASNNLCMKGLKALLGNTKAPPKRESYLRTPLPAKKPSILINEKLKKRRSINVDIPSAIAEDEEGSSRRTKPTASKLVVENEKDLLEVAPDVKFFRAKDQVPFEKADEPEPEDLKKSRLKYG